MPTTILVKHGTPIVLAHTDYGSALGARTHALNLTNLASDAYRQSAKFDFGATHAREWEVTCAVEFTSAPAATGEVMVWIGYSSSATAGTGNPSNLTGADAAYLGYGAAATDATEVIEQLQRIGAFPVSNDIAVQIGHVGLIVPRERYGIVVVRNRTSVALDASDAINMAVRLSPVIDEIQDA